MAFRLSQSDWAYRNIWRYDGQDGQTFSTYGKLQEIKKKYDADNFFADKTGG